MNGFKVGAWGFLLNTAAAAFFFVVYVCAAAVLPVRSYDMSLAVAAAITQPLYLLAINAWIKWMNA